MGPNTYRPADAGGPGLCPSTNGQGTGGGRGADGSPKDEAGHQHNSTKATVDTPALQHINHKAKVARLAEVAGEKAESWGWT